MKSKNEEGTAATASSSGSNIADSACTGDDLPIFVKDILFDEPKSERIEFYNKVTKDLGYSTSKLVPPSFFKNYCISQRSIRYKINQKVCKAETTTNNMLNLETHDGNILNFLRFSNKEYTPRIGDKNIVMASKILLSEQLTSIKTIITEISKYKSNIIDSKNKVKDWQSNELQFYNNNLTELKKLNTLLIEKETQLNTNTEHLRQQMDLPMHDKFEKQRKQRRVKEHVRKEKKKRHNFYVPYRKNNEKVDKYKVLYFCRP